MKPKTNNRIVITSELPDLQTLKNIVFTFPIDESKAEQALNVKASLYNMLFRGHIQCCFLGYQLVPEFKNLKIFAISKHIRFVIEPDLVLVPNKNNPEEPEKIQLHYIEMERHPNITILGPDVPQIQYHTQSCDPITFDVHLELDELHTVLASKITGRIIGIKNCHHNRRSENPEFTIYLDTDCVVMEIEYIPTKQHGTIKNIQEKNESQLAKIPLACTA